MAVDSVTPTIFIMHENGSLVKYIECSEYMTEPSDIAIFGSEYYICDFKGHSIVVMHENGNYFSTIILSTNIKVGHEWVMTLAVKSICYAFR